MSALPRPNMQAYACAPLRLVSIFWGVQEPYYTDDVLPLLAGHLE